MCTYKQFFTELHCFEMPELPFHSAIAGHFGFLLWLVFAILNDAAVTSRGDTFKNVSGG